MMSSSSFLSLHGPLSLGSSIVSQMWTQQGFYLSISWLHSMVLSFLSYPLWKWLHQQTGNKTSCSRRAQNWFWSSLAIVFMIRRCVESRDIPDACHHKLCTNQLQSHMYLHSKGFKELPPTSEANQTHILRACIATRKVLCVKLYSSCCIKVFFLWNHLHQRNIVHLRHHKVKLITSLSPWPLWYLPVLCKHI